MIASRITELRTLASTGKQGPKSAAIIELCDALQACQRRRDKAIGPTLAEVWIYGQEIGMEKGEAENFHDYHQARGWKMGKTASAPMRDWKAAMRLWKRNGKSPGDGKPAKEPPTGWKEFLKAKGHNYDGEYRHAREWLRLEFLAWKKEAGRTKYATLNLS